MDWLQLENKLRDWKDPDPDNPQNHISAADIAITIEELIETKIQEALDAAEGLRDD